MTEDGQTPRRSRRTLLPVALATAAVAVALPVSAALAGGGDGGSSQQGGTALPVQESQQPEQRPDRPDREPCPEGERGGGNDNQESTLL